MENTLTILGSGSSGNGYLLETDGGIVVLELGLSFATYAANIPDMSKVRACLVSHRHSDHLNPKTVKKFLRIGVPVYANQDVADACDIPARAGQISVIEPAKAYMLGGGYIAQGMNLTHSVPNTGFLLRHESLGKLVFATDTNSFPYKFKDINHFVIEANYDGNIIIDDRLQGNNTRSNYHDHLSVQQCKEAVDRNNNVALKTITLIHLSNDNSDYQAFASEFENHFKGVQIGVADGLHGIQIIKL